MWENFLVGASIIFKWHNIAAIVFGSAFGIIVGAIPGLTATMAVALMIPMTFNLEPVTAIMMLLGVYKGGIYGGSISAILIKTPGTPAAAATVLDGYQLTQQGKSGKALKMAIYASCMADTLSDFVLIAVAPPLARFALRFGPREIAMLILFGLTVIAGVSGRSIIKGMISGAFGLLLATVGLDPILTTRRFTFDIVDLDSGISLIPFMIGLFALSEVFFQLGKKGHTEEEVYAIPRSKRPEDNRVSWSEFKANLKTILRGTFIGTVIGVIPGIGTGIAAFISYGEAKRASKHPEEFGKGSLEGVAAAEAGNSAVCGATLIPLLTLGIPGDIVTAVIMGAFLIHGLVLGPLLFKEHAALVYALFVGIIVCDVTYFLLAFLFIRIAYVLGKVPRSWLFPIVMVFCVVGAYAINNSLFDLGVMLAAGILGYYMQKFGYALAPMLIAFILGPIGETAIRQSLLMSNGSVTIFFTRPIALFFLALTALSIFAIVSRHLRKTKTLPLAEDAPYGDKIKERRRKGEGQEAG